MSTAYIVQSAPVFEENSPIALKTSATNSDPLSYRNLQIVRRLGKGKFPVYLANSKVNNQNYVMKVFSNPDEDCERYYQNEIRFAFLNHQNVISIVGADKDKVIVQTGLFMKVTYVLSEYASHGDFFDFMTKHRHEIDEKLARTYFRQIIEGIEYLHSTGVAHLDLKPENLLIGDDFNIKIADFDLSYVEGDHEIVGGGTRLYRGPEFYDPKSDEAQLKAPAASDIYSAGIILFLLKSRGIYPHLENQFIEGVNLTDLMEKNSNKFWSKHSQLQGKSSDFFDHSFKSLFRKMTKPNPKSRISIKKIKKSKWYNGPVYTPEELQIRMKAILKL